MLRTTLQLLVRRENSQTEVKSPSRVPVNARTLPSPVSGASFLKCWRSRERARAAFKPLLLRHAAQSGFLNVPLPSLKTAGNSTHFTPT